MLLYVRLAGYRLNRKLLSLWLSLVMSMCLFVLSFFPRDVLDEIFDLIESISEGFRTYSYNESYFYYALSAIILLTLQTAVCLAFDPVKSN